MARGNCEVRVNLFMIIAETFASLAVTSTIQKDVCAVLTTLSMTAKETSGNPEILSTTHSVT